MILNLVLLVVVFGVNRWKKYPYLGALIFALVKGGLYFVAPLQTLPLWMCAVNSVIGFLVFGALSCGMLYFLHRLGRYEPQEVSYSPVGSERAVFKWEYIPLSLIVLVLILGEAVFNVYVRPGAS